MIAIIAAHASADFIPKFGTEVAEDMALRTAPFLQLAPEATIPSRGPVPVWISVDNLLHHSVACRTSGCGLSFASITHNTTAS
jgi:hypothetical protein